MQRQVKVEKLRQIIKGKCLIIVKMKGRPEKYANISVIALLPGICFSQTRMFRM